MDLTITTTTTTSTKFVDTESETPPPTAQPIKPLASINTNGIVRKHHYHHHHHHPPPPATAYKECLKNHAASIGAHAVDGCGEFMPSPDCTAIDPTSLKCAACGCHRNFHRREHNDPITPTAATHFLEYHRNPSRRGRASSSSPSPPPPSNYGYAPHMLLALSTAVTDEQHALVATPGTPTEVKNEDYPSGRKRFRTKFSQEQKERMSTFAEKLGWKMQRCDDGMVDKFCNEVGIGRSVLKVWMHNNKNTFAKKLEKDNITPTTTTTTPITTTTNGRIGFDNIDNVNGQRQVSTNYGSNSSS